MSSRGWRDRQATTAMEVAVVAPVLLLFIFAVFGLGLDQFMQQTLDDSVRNAARQVALGKITTGPGFAAAVCTEFTWCGGSTLQYYVVNAATFGAMTPAALRSNGTLSTTGWNVSHTAGSTANDALLVQVAYKIPVQIPLVPGVLTGNGTPALLSAVATAMEP